MRRLADQAATGRTAIIGVVAASGQVVRCAVAAGADLLLALNAGAYRTHGHGTVAAFLPFRNANDETEALLRDHVLWHAGEVPIVAGVLASDPTCMVEERLTRLEALGVSGIVNWPTSGFVDGRFRQAIEEAGLGIDSELAMLARAKETGFTTFGFAMEPEAAMRFAAAGVDGLILNLGLTWQVEDVHERRERLQQSIVRLNRMLDAVARVGGPRLCLAYGGAVTLAEDLEEVFRHCPVQGFAGGSVFDRLPVQSVVTAMVRNFKGIVVGHATPAVERGMDQIIGQSAAMREVFRDVRRIAPFDVNVCLEGESGTGKELVATQIHRLSQRARHAFVTLNCGAIPETLLESELFGHEKGAFTGADRRRLGKFELAHQGTLFLDEIADLSPHGQVALLRAIQQREITRVGGETLVPADVRIIAASHRNLGELVRQGRFRDDLFYRLNYVTISIPPLRERKDDIPLLVQALLSQLQVQVNRRLLGISAAFADKLQRHAWPGNVRELQQVVGQAALLEDGPVLEGQRFRPLSEFDLPASVEIDALGDSARWSPRSRNLAARRALTAARGNKTRAAESLGIARKTLYEWLRES